MERIQGAEISRLNYKDLTEKIGAVSEVDFKEISYIEELIQCLKKDSRKNVFTLGTRLTNRYEKYKAETARVRKLYEFDRTFGNFEFVAGIDEVGRGPLAGPIVAAAVVLKNQEPLEDCMILGLNDSKKLSQDNREKLHDIIIKNSLYYKISLMDNYDIDNRGIAYCNNAIFIQACSGLGVEPDLVLTDGYPIRNYKGNNKGIVKGDTKSASIAAASIIAKVFRDRLMEEYARKYPQYGFERNAGYGSQEHIAAIKEYGPTPIHRMSFLRGILG